MPPKLDFFFFVWKEEKDKERRKNVLNSQKKVFWPAFCWAQYPKAGQNTQHCESIFVSKTVLIHCLVRNNSKSRSTNLTQNCYPLCPAIMVVLLKLLYLLSLKFYSLFVSTYVDNVTYFHILPEDLFDCIMQIWQLLSFLITDFTDPDNLINGLLILSPLWSWLWRFATAWSKVI